MPRCEICYEDVDKVYTCKLCQTEFCEECGDPRKRVCALCLDEGEEGEVEEDEEEEVEEDDKEEEEQEGFIDEEEEEFGEEEDEEEEDEDSRSSRRRPRYLIG